MFTLAVIATLIVISHLFLGAFPKNRKTYPKLEISLFVAEKSFIIMTIWLLFKNIT